jgi:hypothetical protein
VGGEAQFGSRIHFGRSEPLEQSLTVQGYSRREECGDGVNEGLETATFAIEGDDDRITFAKNVADPARAAALRAVLDEYAYAILPGRLDDSAEVQRLVALLEDGLCAGLFVRKVASTRTS